MLGFLCDLSFSPDYSNNIASELSNKYNVVFQLFLLKF